MIFMEILRTATTQQVATALHLRPATVQLYARQGRIPFDTTPGGHRRFNTEEVRRVVAMETEPRGATTTKPGRVRNWLVDATDLESWADRRIAQEELPEILRLLIAGSTAELRRLEFRSGEGVTLGGWDGLVDAVKGNAWVPVGESGWELGTSEGVTAKANDDYEKRTKNPLGLDMAQTAFVFVTPRRWSRRDSWATTKRAEGIWKDVRAYDADSLAGWLDTTPAVHARVTKLLGRDPEGASDVLSAWEAWAGQTAPILPSALLTGGRNEQRSMVVEWLQGSPSAMSVVADSQEEALAFILACVVQLPADERALVESQALVIHSKDAWNEIRHRMTSHMILIPTFANPATAEATATGHHVVLPLDQNAMTIGDKVTFPRLRYEPALQALIATGIPEHQAKKFAAVARRSLLVLRRELAINRPRPYWAEPERVSEIIPLVLAGAWRADVPADCEVVAALANRSYGDLTTALTYWAMQTDPPVRAISNLWFITSRDEAWALAARHVTNDHLGRFHDRAIEVLGTSDPAMELEPKYRWTAGILGKASPWSHNLRSGLAEAIALVATRRGDLMLAGGETGQRFADRIVRVVLGRANADTSGHLWSSLTDVLPVLAEASPEQFLDAVDTGLAGGLLMAVFDPAAEELHFNWPTHTGLLWALEVLAWSPDYLGSAAVLLAKLAERDPGGRWANRPLSSLREIFVVWRPHTRASLDDEIAALDGLRRSVPTVAWMLMIRLLPSGHEVSTGTYHPRWRDWEPEELPSVTFAEWSHQVDLLVERLIIDAGSDAARWADLVTALDNLPEAAHEAIVGQLQRLDLASLAEDRRLLIADALRTIVHRHRAFPGAAWALPTTYVDRLEAEWRRFNVADPVIGAVWLFRRYVELPGPQSEDFETRHEALMRARDEAVRVCLEGAGLEGIWALASRCEVPWFVGVALGRIDNDVDTEILAHLSDLEPTRQQVVRGFVTGRFMTGSWAWANKQLGQADAWPLESVVAFLQCLPAEPATLDRVQQLGSEGSRAYWQTIPSMSLFNAADRVGAIQMLLVNGRATASLPLLASCIRDETTHLDLNVELIIAALAKAEPDATQDDVAMFSHYVMTLLNHLATDKDIDRSRLAELEWRFLPFFKDGRRPPRVLHEELGREPGFFVEVVSWVYKSDTQREDLEVTDEDRARAMLGDELLDSWHTPPGTGYQGSLGLTDWITTARTLLTERGLIGVGDRHIGSVLRYAPSAPDGVWPAMEVREVIEIISSQDLERGIELEVMNSRGVTSRGLTDGGAQERVLVRRYREWAQQIGNQWPRTRRMLERVAADFEYDAHRQDQQAEIQEDFRS